MSQAMANMKPNAAKRMATTVSDAFVVTRDAKMSSLVAALDPEQAHAGLSRLFVATAGAHDRLHLRAIRVVRYKPERRCVIEYDMSVEREGQRDESMVLLGKVRAGRYGKAGLRLARALWEHGFDAGSVDGISVPEPIGHLSTFRMWLQRKVPGVLLTDLLTPPARVCYANRVAEAARKVHRAGVPPERTHTMADELRILTERLRTFGRARPQWVDRVNRVLAACHELGAEIPDHEPCGIHRDFYPDQLIVDGDRVWVLDFDLYCLGDPAVDIGNFIAHLTEQSLRVSGSPDGLAELEAGIERRFLELGDGVQRQSIQTYKTLTLARLIQISTLIPERHAITEPLLELCEARLGVSSTQRTGAADARH